MIFLKIIKKELASAYEAIVQEVLGERVKAFLVWQNAVSSLQKRREQRSRLELGGKLDRMGAILEVQCTDKKFGEIFPQMWGKDQVQSHKEGKISQNFFPK